jgi:hypothetical protein
MKVSGLWWDTDYLFYQAFTAQYIGVYLVLTPSSLTPFCCPDSFLPTKFDIAFCEAVFLEVSESCASGLHKGF